MHAGFTTTSGSTTPRWRIISARELPAAEKGDKHHVFVNLLDQAGADARGATSIKSGWEGMAEAPIITPTDKPQPEPAANVPIFQDQRLWIEVDAGTAASDRASGMDAHHTYEVVFQYDPGISLAPLPDPAAHLALTNSAPTRSAEPDAPANLQPWAPAIEFLAAEEPDPLPNQPTKETEDD